MNTRSKHLSEISRRDEDNSQAKPPLNASASISSKSLDPVGRGFAAWQESRQQPGFKRYMECVPWVDGSPISLSVLYLKPKQDSRLSGMTNRGVSQPPHH